MEWATTAWYIQNVLMRNTSAMQAEFAGLVKLDIYGFLASMPSLHLAHETIMHYYCRQSAVAPDASATFILATCTSVVVLGWHYLLDIAVGVFLALGVIRGVSLMTRERISRQVVA